MERIASFNVDHRYIKEGVYISRIDGDITTYDLRMRKPNTGDLISNSALHSFEHMFATFVRNSSMKDNIIYVGPMGCQTGFYLLVRNADGSKVIDLVKDSLLKIMDYEGEVFGKSEIECGNYKNLSLEAAKDEAKRYFDKIKDITEENLAYPSEGQNGKSEN